MTPLPKKNNIALPSGLVLEQPAFVPRLVMTEELRRIMRDVIDQWRKRDRFTELVKYGIRPLDRILFYGPPGNGKTMACFSMSRELDVPMYRVNCANLHGSCLGDTTKAVHDVLKFLNDQTEPALCLWDEVEAIFIDRKRSSGQCDREIQAALTIFLQALDRWKAPIMLVMATNLPDQLDEALLSRVEMRVEFVGPSPAQCAQMLEYWSELLHDHGGADWGPKLAAITREKAPASFRELQQTIGFAARAWTVNGGGNHV